MFDLAAYKRAFEAKDVEAWIAFYADDAEWIEYTPEAAAARAGGDAR